MTIKPNAQAFLDMIDTHKGIIYKIANSYCKDKENRKDLIQEIIIRLWLAFEKYDPTYKISTWMYTIALNVSISFYRKEHRRHQINHSLPEVIHLYEQTEVDDTHVAIERLQLFIKELKEIDRAVMLLYLEDTSQEEIAQILGITSTNVSTKIYRIKQQLKQKFSTINT
ncbi:sigma-70 family RNA polymerase sigma factor [Cytophagaceae bacterium YF14B1]|uniref:Sigma-70 family RNA polymerase sigma factor n=1 Tax=Xanthocytophaga flava TaxID=3048013 RepID=A0AAE3UAI0_9BACT|nr:sigma-70 family RNA polymerase sigma factor [Xanthocytophaga flavus]MDJ1482809.1 sigma-70 family RNA polymerase sigma factor [Xanthocytophaga flavus]